MRSWLGSAGWILVIGWSSPALATCMPFGAFTGETIPSNGTTQVPRNARIVVDLPIAAGETDITLETNSGVVIPGQVEHLDHTVAFEPEALLPEHTALVAVVHHDGGALEQTLFTTGADIDEETPSEPEKFSVRFDQFVAEQAETCHDAYWIVDLEWEGGFDASQVGFDVRGTFARPDERFTPQALWTAEPRARLLLAPDQVASLTICAVDAAGNEACSETVQIDVPAAPGTEPDASGAVSCSLGIPGDAPISGALAALLLLPLLWVPRRRAVRARR